MLIPKTAFEVSYFHPIKFIQHIRLICQGYLQTEFAIELIKDWFQMFQNEECYLKLEAIFGTEIKKSKFNSIRNSIIQKTYEYPRILIIESSDRRKNKLYGHAAGYNHKTEKIWVDREFVEQAKTNNFMACSLLIALIEEIGHDIDQKLRKGTDQGDVTSFDEGAVFSANVLGERNFKLDVTSVVAIDTTDKVEVKVDLVEMNIATSVWLNEFHLAQDDKSGDLSFTGIAIVLGGIANAVVEAAIQVLTIYLKEKHPISDVAYYWDELDLRLIIISFIAGMASGGIGAIAQIVAKSNKLRILVSAVLEVGISFEENLAKSLVSNGDWNDTISGIGIDLISRVVGIKGSTEVGQVLLTNLSKGLINSGELVLGEYVTKDFSKTKRDINYYRENELDKWEFNKYRFFM